MARFTDTVTITVRDLKVEFELELRLGIGVLLTSNSAPHSGPNPRFSTGVLWCSSRSGSWYLGYWRSSELGLREQGSLWPWFGVCKHEYG